MNRLAGLLTRHVNPLHLAVLRSPAHRLFSLWLVGLDFPGRRSGRPYRLPIGFAQVDGRVLVATDAAWQHNFTAEHPVAVWLHGRRRTGTGRLRSDPSAWAAVLQRRPVVGRLARIRRDPDGRPDALDLRRAASRGWTVVEVRLNRPDNRDDLTGRTAVVTGATSGIGRAAALALARRGAQVIAVGRDRVRGAEVAAHPGITFVSADLSVQREVRAVASAVPDRPLDILVHSAGGHVLQRRVTVDGVEANWAVNFVSKFLLTELLRDRLVAAAGRVVVVGSPIVDPARFLRLDGAHDRPTFALRALLDSGLATAVWSVELERRLAGTGVDVVDLDPGLVTTGVSRTWPAPLRALDRAFQTVAGVPATERAQDVVWLATTTRLPGPFVRGSQAVQVPRSTTGRGLGAAVWRLGRELTGGTA